MDTKSGIKGIGYLDAENHLKRQGWRGLGYSLDQQDRGIKRPVLYTHKADKKGLGTKRALVDDQWWLQAFDQSLKDFGTGKKSALAQARESGVKRGGLYGFFVKGEKLQATFDYQESSNINQSPNLNSTQSLSGDSSDSDSDSSSTSTAESTSASESASDTSVTSPIMSDPSNEVAAVNGESQSLKRKREPKESNKQVRKRRKEERIAKQERHISQKREKQIADCSYDFNAEAERNKVRDLNRRLSNFIKQCEREGLFTKSALLAEEARKKAAKRAAEQESSAQFDGNNGMNPQRLAMIQGPVESVPDKNLSYKAEKFLREARKRELKRAERKRLVEEMWPDSQPPKEEDLLPADKRAKREAEKAEKKRVQREKEEAKKAKQEAKEAEKAIRLEAKKKRREDRQRQREEEALQTAGNESDDEASSGDDKPSKPVASDAEPKVNGAKEPRKTKKELYKEKKRAREQAKLDEARATAAAEMNGDLIKFDDSWDFNTSQTLPQTGGKPKNLPGNMTREQYIAHIAEVGKVKRAERQALVQQLSARKDDLSSQEKKQLHSLQDDIRDEDQVRDYVLRQGLPESFAPPANVTTATESSVSAPAIETLSEAKRAKYAARAAEKGVSVEEYIARRAVKNAEKKAEKSSEAVNTNEAMDIDNDASLGFVVDTTGDAALAIPETSVKVPSVFGKLELPIDPVMWADRKAKELTKAERFARLQYIRARRALRKEKKGESTMSAKERRKRRVEHKLEMQNQLGRQLLESEGVNTQRLKPNEVLEARRRAKKMLRAAKKGKEVPGLPEEMRLKVVKKKPKGNRQGGRNG